MNAGQYEAAVEAILFTMGESVEREKIAEALDITAEEVDETVKRLTKRYEPDSCGIRIIELDGAYQMCTKASQYEYLIRIAKQPRQLRLTDVLLETLSIIAYKQPVTRVEIENIRGVSCAHAVNRLVEIGLVREVGRMEAPGRPILFGTTEEFLRCFGVRSTDDLPMPDPDRVEEFKSEAESEAGEQPSGQ